MTARASASTSACGLLLQRVQVARRDDALRDSSRAA